MVKQILSVKQKAYPPKFDFVEQQKYAPENFAKIHNAKIFNKYSMICDQSNNPIEFCLNEFLFWQPSTLRLATDVSQEVENRKEKAFEYAKNAPKNNVITLNTDNDYVYLMHSFGWYPYGHLFDCLQRLYPLRDKKLFSPHYLCCDYRRVKDFNEHMKFLGIKQNAILSFNRWDVIEVPNLVVGFSPSHIACFTLDTINWILDRYINKNVVFDKYRAIRKREKNFILYLEREGAGRRNVTNSKEIIKQLTDENYDIQIFTGSENLIETIWLFYNAKVVIGAHGAAFINTIFCKKDTLILEFCPQNRLYISIAEIPKPSINHKIIIVKGDNDFNIRIDIEFLKEELRNLYTA